MEEGLKAFHKITTNIAVQDEKIWRQNAAKKCLKKEIENMEEQSKRHELQIAIIKKDPLFGKYEEYKQLMEENINENIQILKLLSLSISSKRVEIEQREKDLKSWDQKYTEAISELKEAYHLKRDWIESTNPTFKKLLEIRAAQKAAEVRLKQLKATTIRRQRNKKQFRIITDMIFHKTIVNFVDAVQRKKQYLKIDFKLKTLEDKKKKMVKEMFETQEALKKYRVRHTQIPNGIFPNKVPTLPPHGLFKKNDTRRPTAQNPTVEKKIESRFGENKKEFYLPPTPKKRALPPHDRLNIISNKVIALPPLKTILSRQISKADTSFNKSFESSFNKTQNSQIENEKNESIAKLSQESTKTDKAEDNKDNKTAMEPPLSKVADAVKPSDYLKNLKFTTQSNKFQIPKVSTSFFKQNSQSIQKTSILKTQDKKKLKENIDNSNLDTSLRRKEKNVNFASPIHQNMEIDETSSTTNDNVGPLNKSSNFNMSGFLNREISKNAFLDDDTMNTQGQEPHFSFEAMEKSDLSDGIEPSENSQSGRNMVSNPIFGGVKDSEMSFGFSFGGPSKSNDEMWDLFG